MFNQSYFPFRKFGAPAVSRAYAITLVPVRHGEGSVIELTCFQILNSALVKISGALFKAGPDPQPPQKAHQDLGTIRGQFFKSDLLVVLRSRTDPPAIADV